MSKTITKERIETDSARAPFLELRRMVGLPDGGEVVLKEEVKEVAGELMIDVREDWTKERIVFEILKEVGRTKNGYTWKDAQRPIAARSYDYFQSQEVEMVVEELRERHAEFEWGRCKA